jgi:filamentous hemagglutinin family protein
MPELFMQNKIAALGGLLIVAANLTATAQISMDGTLGRAGPLAGPNYQVTADLGQQHGGNLFHSFGQFSILSGESATFSGPNSISNIIGRVTGGQVSSIDGTIRSTIPGANLYLLNPAGVLFGEHAQVDVGGSFHVSAADYLRLGDGGRFEARTPGNSVLTAAPVAAFGFLGDAPGKITINGSFLQVREGQTLSLIGGDLTLHNAMLVAPAGRINLAAVASAGEVLPTATGLEMGGFDRLGDLTVFRDPGVARTRFGEIELGDVDTSGRSGGAIFIRGGSLLVEGGQLYADTYGDQAGIGIDIALSGDLRLSRNAQITSVTAGAGAAGAITFVGEQASLDGGSVLATATSSVGNAGAITLDVKSLNLNGGSQIATITSGSGRGGSIHVTAHERVEIAGVDDDGIPSILHASAIKDSTGSAGAITVTSPLVSLRDGGGIYSDSEEGPGDAGVIALNVSQLSLSGGSVVRANTFDAGRGGQLTITASDRIDIAGGGATNGISSGLYTVATLFGSTGAAGNIAITSPILTLNHEGIIASITGGTGDAGDITLNVGELRLNSGSVISVGTFDAGKGGLLTVAARDRIEITGGSILDAGALGLTGSAGSIHLTSPILILSDDGFVKSDTGGAGNAGVIDLHVGQLNLSSGGAMSVNTLGAGRGGSLSIIATGRIDIAGAATNGNLSGLAADAMSGATGSAGTITLVSPVLALDENGVIGSTTYGVGDAGAINLEVGSLSLSGGGEIATATAGAGSGGTIAITAHERVDIAGSNAQGEYSLLSADALPGSTGSAGTISLSSPVLAMRDSGRLQSMTYGSGAAGVISLEVGQLSLNGGSKIHTATAGSGLGGTITVTAHERVDIAGADAQGKHSSLLADALPGSTGSAGTISLSSPVLAMRDSGQLQSTTAGLGDAGTIALNVGRLSLESGSRINISTTGAGGNGRMTIHAAERIDILGKDAAGDGSGLFARAIGEAAGAAGSITLSSPVLAVSDDGLISSSTQGIHDAGDITLDVGQISLRSDGKVNTNTWGFGDGGDLKLTSAETVTISGANSGLFANAYWAGKAGNIAIATPRLTLTDGGSITAGSIYTSGGDVVIHADHTLLQNGGEILVSIYGDPSKSQGGDASVNGHTLVILDSPGISAQAVEGRGGNITVNTDVFLHNAPILDDVLSASSEVRGNDGMVTVNSPPVNIAGTLVKAPATYLDASGQLQRRCGRMAANERNQLTVPGRGALPPEPEGPLPESSRCAAEPVVVAESAPMPVAAHHSAQIVEPSNWGDQ